MPFSSKAQQRYMHAHPEVLGKKGLQEWDSKTNFSHLPAQKGKRKFSESARDRSRTR